MSESLEVLAGRRDELERELRSVLADIRGAVLLELERGASVTQLATTAGVSRKTVHAWINGY